MARVRKMPKVSKSPIWLVIEDVRRVSRLGVLSIMKESRTSTNSSQKRDNLYAPAVNSRIRFMVYESNAYLSFARRHLKQGIDKRRNSTPFSEDDQKAQKEQRDQNREEPIAFSNFQEFPEFADKRLIRHSILLNIV